CDVPAVLAWRDRVHLLAPVLVRLLVEITAVRGLGGGIDYGHTALFEIVVEAVIVVEPLQGVLIDPVLVRHRDMDVPDVAVEVQLVDRAADPGAPHEDDVVDIDPRIVPCGVPDDHGAVAVPDEGVVRGPAFVGDTETVLEVLEGVLAVLGLSAERRLPPARGGVADPGYHLVI